MFFSERVMEVIGGRHQLRKRTLTHNNMPYKRTDTTIHVSFIEKQGKYAVFLRSI